MKMTPEHLNKLFLVNIKPNPLNSMYFDLDTSLLDELIKLVGDMRNANGNGNNYNADTELDVFKKDAEVVVRGNTPKRKVTFQRLYELINPLQIELSKALNDLQSTKFDQLSRRTVLLLFALTSAVYKMLFENHIHDAPLVEYRALFTKIQAETKLLIESNPGFNTFGHHKSQLAEIKQASNHHAPTLS